MKRTIFKWLALAVAVAFAAPSYSFAQTTTRKRSRHREVRQEERIRQGVKSGELTKDEAQGLQQEQREIRRDRRQMVQDGKLTPEERRKLEQEQNKASKHIYGEKHDTEERPKAP
ncbi:MAG: hypothetical protein V1798_03380 [Pseudomonadota bacterium]